MSITDLLLFVPSWFATVLFVGAMLFCASRKKRKYFWLRIIPCGIVYNVLPFVIPGSYNAWYLTAGDWFSFSYIIFALLLAGIIFLCFEVQVIDVLFYVSAAYALQNLAFHTWSIVCYLIAYSGGVSVPRWASVLIGLFVYAGALTAFYFLIARRARETLNDKAKIRIVAVSVATIIIVYVIDMWLRAAGYGNIGVDIYSIIVNLLLIAAQAGIFKESKYEREQVILAELLRQESKQHKMSEENVNIMNVKFHDLKHRISRARQGDGLDEIEDALDVYNAFVKSGNEVLDIVLTEKSLICKHKEIKLGIIADGNAVSFMSETDIGALFGNILDNAIEAVEKAEPQERMISLNVSAQKGFLSVHEDNRCTEKLIFEDGLPKTTKDSAGFHGFGTKSIKLVTEKYGGKVLMNCADGVFYLEILIPLPQDGADRQ